MDNHCQHLQEVAALVLNCTEDEDCTALQEHVDNCTECYAIYIEHLEVINHIVENDCPNALPPASLKDKVCPKKSKSFYHGFPWKNQG